MALKTLTKIEITDAIPTDFFFNLLTLESFARLAMAITLPKLVTNTISMLHLQTWLPSIRQLHKFYLIRGSQTLE